MAEKKNVSPEKDSKVKTEKTGKAEKTGKKLERRDFLQGLATVPVLGAFGLALYQQVKYDNAQKAAKLGTPKVYPEDLKELQIALLGMGAQGEVLLNAMLKIPGLRFRAVCDIWTEYNQKKTVNLLKKYKFDVNAYQDYRDMLDQEKDLDAVVIATPDFWHARHAIDCLKAGLNVYSGKEMSNNLEDARRMVIAARETGKLLQIGHQRRSNPRYIHAIDRLIRERRLLGRVTGAYAQWN